MNSIHFGAQLFLLSIHFCHCLVVCDLTFSELYRFIVWYSGFWQCKAWLRIRRLSGNYSAILSISRIGLWPWCNLAASQRRPYCTFVNIHSPAGLVSRQWDTVHWACVLCDRRIHIGRASRSASTRQSACPFYSSRAGFFGKASHHPGLSTPQSPDLAPCDFWLFPKLKSPLKKRIFVNAIVTQYKSSVNCVSLWTD